MPPEGFNDSAHDVSPLHRPRRLPEDGLHPDRRSGLWQALCSAGRQSRRAGWRHRPRDAAGAAPTGGAGSVRVPGGDIEHIDHRYRRITRCHPGGCAGRVGVPRAGVLFKNLETKGDPWGQNAKSSALHRDRRGRFPARVPAHRPGPPSSPEGFGSTCSGWLCRYRVRGPGQEDHQARRPSCRASPAGVKFWSWANRR